VTLAEQATALPAQLPVAAATIVGALLAALAAMAVLITSWRQTRERWIAWLIAAWALWIVRYAMGLLPVGLLRLEDAGPVLNPLVLLARDAALAMALRELGVRWFARVWGIAALPVLVAALLGASGEWQRWYLYHLLGATWLAGAIVVARSPRLWERIRLPTALGFLVHAAILLIAPWFGGAGRMGSISVAIATAVHLLIASGVAIGVHQRLLEEREVAEQRVARALEYVVRGIVPMCAYCRSVRDVHEKWVTLEQFVAEGTAGPVVDVRCPDCAGITSPALP